MKSVLYLWQCLSRYLTVMITEGTVRAISCPDAQCHDQGKMQSREVGLTFRFYHRLILAYCGHTLYCWVFTAIKNPQIFGMQLIPMKLQIFTFLRKCIPLNIKTFTVFSNIFFWKVTCAWLEWFQLKVTFCRYLVKKCQFGTIINHLKPVMMVLVLPLQIEKLIDNSLYETYERLKTEQGTYSLLDWEIPVFRTIIYWYISASLDLYVP